MRRQKHATIAKKSSNINTLLLKTIAKLGTIYYYTGKYRGAVLSICISKCSVPKEIIVIFHNGSNYAYHFIIKEPAKEFEGELFELFELFMRKY